MDFRLPHRLVSALTVLGLGACLASAPALADPAPATTTPQVHVQQKGHGIDIQLDGNRIELRLVRGNVLHVHYQPDGKSTPPSLVMSPDAPRHAAVPVQVQRHGHVMTMTSPSLGVSLDTRTLALSVSDRIHHRWLLRQADLADLAQHKLELDYASGAPMYGIHSFSAQGGPLYGTPDCSTVEHDTTGLLRRGRQVAKACPEGGAGAPFVWSTRGFGLLVDTKTATFDIGDHSVSVAGTSRPDLSYYIISGRPDAIFTALADLSGHPQLFPKWATGFTNSQWGIDQKQLLAIVHTYRSKHIPIDNFTLDFDWKAWGQDHYGEFRWNAKKFPDGPSGKLARELAAEGLQLTGIMKPRIHVDTVEGRYATVHHLWVPGEKATDDYFSHKLVRDIDFDKPAARHWFGQKAIQYGFDKGIVGWWNDEADEIDDNTQFLNMERALYNAQRAHTDIRVWSINRSFWLGAQRYAYGMWSGDIQTGFASMARQRLRMLNAVTIGATLWGMDGGGFNGHPSDENYARWIEFGAFTPIFRVHGVKPEKRQPWRYGPIAEKAATHAIRLRYRLIPYIYSYFWQGHASGIGLVRPLAFGWPHDPKTRNDVDAWMFGDWLLVSPVVVQGQTEKQIYLPAGTWTEWTSGKVYTGGQSVTVATDSVHWGDIPLFIRQGAIIPTQPVMDYVGQHPVTTLSVDVFPASQATHFDYYDDNGRTYAYEHGSYFLQTLTTQRHGHSIRFATDKPKGSFKTRLAFYLLKIHGSAASAVRSNGKNMASFGGLDALRGGNGEGWATGQDRFGPVTYVRVAAARAESIQLALPR
ncbi:MAG: glycoside hydrolase family 31 protein [Rhodanobacter sp.]|nr:MAG: glycoside hydrolase family 31 protein [Rhodanobacter sp.]